MNKDFKTSKGLIAPYINLTPSTTAYDSENGNIWTATDGVYARINNVTSKLSVFTGNEADKTYVDNNDFLNFYSKAGYNFGSNEVPVYADFKFSLGTFYTSSFSFIDSSANQVIYFSATTPLKKNNMFRAYRVSSNTDYIFDNNPISLNNLNPNEYVRSIYNAGTKFVCLGLSNNTAPYSYSRTVLVKTNGSSKWTEWGQVYDVTSIASGVFNFSIIETTQGDRILRLVYNGDTSILTVYDTSLTQLRTLTLYNKSLDVNPNDMTLANRTGADISFGYNPYGLAFPFTWNPYTERFHQKNSGWYQQTLATGSKQGVGYSLNIAWYIPKQWFEDGSGTPSNLIPFKNSTTYRYNAYSDDTWNTNDGGMATGYGNAGTSTSIVTDEYSGKLHIMARDYWSSVSAGRNIVLDPLTVDYKTFGDNIGPSILLNQLIPIPDASPWSKSLGGSAVIAIGNHIGFYARSNTYGSQYIYTTFDINNFNSVARTNDTLILDSENAVVGLNEFIPTAMTGNTTNGNFSTTVTNAGPVYSWVVPTRNIHIGSASGVTRTWTDTNITAPGIPATIDSYTSIVYSGLMTWNGNPASPVFWAMVKSNNNAFYIAKYENNVWSIPGGKILELEIATGNAARGDSAFSATFSSFTSLLTESGKFIFFSSIPNVSGTTFYVTSYDTVTNTIDSNSWDKFKSTTAGSTVNDYPSVGGYGGLCLGYNSYFGYYAVTNTTTYDSLCIVSSKDIRGIGTEISESTWYSTPNARYEQWITVQSAVGLKAYVTEYPLFLGGYLITVPNKTLTLTPNATSYVYVTKTSTDRTSVDVYVSTDFLPDSFNTVKIAKIITNSSNIVESTTYPIIGNGLPDQVNNENKILSTDGRYPIWIDPPSTLPDQTNNQNKLLSTDGANTLWIDPPDPLPSISGNSGKYLYTNGTTTSWANVSVITQLSGIDNTYANALLISGPSRTNDAVGDTWLFADSKGSDTNKYGIKHNQLGDAIEFWGANNSKIIIDLINGGISATSSANGGFRFRANPGGGSGDDASITYFAVSGEKTVLQLAVSNDGIGSAQDSINLVASGGVGINTESPSEAFHVTGNILASGDITAFSDISLKTNIQPIVNSLDTVKNLEGVTYERVDTGEHGMGVIAQQLQKHLPNLVKVTNDGKLSVNYNGLSGLFIECFKELINEIDLLKSEIKKLKGE